MFRPDMSFAESNRAEMLRLKERKRLNKIALDSMLVMSGMQEAQELKEALPTLSDAKFITNESATSLENDETVKNRMQSAFGKFAEKEVVEYLMKHLSIAKQRILLPHFDLMYDKLKTTSNNYTKTSLLNWIFAYIKDLKIEESNNGVVNDLLQFPATTTNYTDDLDKLFSNYKPPPVIYASETINAPASSKRDVGTQATLTINTETQTSTKSNAGTQTSTKNKSNAGTQTSTKRKSMETQTMTEDEEVPAYEPPVEVETKSSSETEMTYEISQEIAKIKKITTAPTFYNFTKITYNVDLRDAPGKWQDKRKKFIENDLPTLFNAKYKVTGKGIKKRKQKRKRIVMVGSGIAKQPAEKYFNLNNMHKLDLFKLKKGILHASYISNGKKPVRLLSNKQISKDAVDCVNNIIQNKFNNKEYLTLTYADRKAIKTLNDSCKLGLEINDDEIQKEAQNFELLYGEFKAGNNNPQLLQKLRLYVIDAMNENRMPKALANGIIHQIAMSK